MAWLAATVGLSRSQAALALPSLDSLLTADYSAEPEAPPVLPPLDVAIIETAIEDEQALLAPPAEANAGREPVFAPIFVSGQGNQEPPPAPLEDDEPDSTSPGPAPTSDGPVAPEGGGTPTTAPTPTTAVTPEGTGTPVPLTPTTTPVFGPLPQPTAVPLPTQGPPPPPTQRPPQPTQGPPPDPGAAA